MDMSHRKIMGRPTVYCPQGHGYDPTENKVCPHCYGEEANKELGVTQKAKALYDFDEDLMPTESGTAVKRSFREEKQVEEKEMPAEELQSMVDDWSWDDAGETVSGFAKNTGIDPIAGWLVAVNGRCKGRDYRIHSENNYIGRSMNMDICIPEDDMISRENHASIAYDTRAKKFYFTPCNNRNIARVNENAVFATTELAPYDIIELGATSFVFVPFCGEQYDWTELFSKGVEGV